MFVVDGGAQSLCCAVGVGVNGNRSGVIYSVLAGREGNDVAFLAMLFGMTYLKVVLSRGGDYWFRRWSAVVGVPTAMLRFARLAFLSYIFDWCTWNYYCAGTS